MPLEITSGTELQSCVQRWVDADLLLVEDGEALIHAIRARTETASQLWHLLRQVETLVTEGDLTAAEAAPALGALRRALEG